MNQKTLIRLLAGSMALMLALGACASPGASDNTTDDAQNPVPTVAAEQEESPAAEETPAAEPEAANNALQPRLQDDFYEAVNFDQLQNIVIPDDEVAAGGANELYKQIESNLTADLQAGLAAGGAEKDDAQAQMYRFYQLALDFDRLNSEGIAPLTPSLEQIESLKDFDDLKAQLIPLYSQGVISMPFQFYVSDDMQDATQNAVYLSGTGTILPEKSYYDEGNPTGQQFLELYSQTLQNVLVLAGKTAEQAAQIAENTLAFDALIVPYTKSAEESSDYTQMYNPVSRADFESKYNGTLDILSVIDAYLPTPPATIVVTNTDYFEHLGDILSEASFDLFRDWNYSLSIMEAAPYLSDEFREATSQYSMALTGTTELQDRKREAFQLTDSMFGQVLGQIYVEKYFSAEAKADVEQMVDNMIAVYEKRLSENDWLSEDTKAAAIKKLQNISVKIGYPDTIPSYYDSLQVDDSRSLLDNIMMISEVVMQDNYAKYGNPVDRSEWVMSPQTINAMYNPQANDITFPAGILQAPFYDLEQGASKNYGGIGTIIAHEISHAFDTNGSKYDELGNLKDWWTAADYTEFETRTQAMVDQFSAETFMDKPVNGQLTISENVADAGGLSCALEVVEGLPEADLTAFFENYASIWCVSMRPEYAEILLSVDVHAPHKLRVNTQVKNLDPFFTTFDIKEEDGMWLAPESRIHIW